MKSQGSDFLTSTGEADWFITNPPFSNITRWLEHSALMARKGFAYILPLHALSHRRIKLMADFGFYISKIAFFDNPKEWQIGFSMAFVIWTLEVDSTDILLMNKPTTVQTRLTD